MPLMETQDTGKYFNEPYQEFLKTSIEDYGTQQLQKKEEEIAQRELKVQTIKKSSKMPYIILGIVAIGLIATSIVLKKKKVF